MGAYIRIHKVALNEAPSWIFPVTSVGKHVEAADLYEEHSPYRYGHTRIELCTSHGFTHLQRRNSVASDLELPITSRHPALVK